MPVTLINDGSTVLLELSKSKASAEVRLFGATVTSWKTTGGIERLFLSQKAALDGSAAIRGGIPLVFPVFGPPKDHADAPAVVTKLPKHGFARDHNWAVSNSEPQINQEDRASVTLQLRTSDKSEIKAVWPFDTLLKYTVTLTPNDLVCRLAVEHLSESSASEDMPFHALLHNYFLVPDSTKASIVGLKDLFYIDKVAGGEEGQVTTEEFTIHGEPVDRVHVGKHKHSSPSEGAIDVKLLYNASLLQDPLGRMGKGVEVSRSDNLRETVVWNCAEVGNKGIGDLEEGGWKKYVCVEPGAVRGFQSLAKGQTWVAEQKITAW
ncbi:galactose mutarotase-like protein [Testicularia cyperi]|uniref:Glucose-6-phosphate 1-epimerase n=1 Tax=Testicularia cyperi TaxID=1882483 RepID=A0A317XQ64_9BASI|nr:galactose mutarotase-like protein [Testicularia cyperi]